MNERESVRKWDEEAGRVIRVRLCEPPGNLLDQRLVAALRQALADVPSQALAVVLDTEGPHFSYGASIPEHAPDPVGPALREFHGLIRAMLACPVPLVAVVRGRCLGGGLELAAACDVIFASRDAQLGTPEVRLGSFAPVASLLLPERMGSGAASDLLLSGRAIGADEALRNGLVQHVDDDAEVAAFAWLRDHVLALSPTSMRFAVGAARLALTRRVLPLLIEMEKLYLHGLMRTDDPAEGVRAFLEKRSPVWSEPR
jgi:cyclohexa-1,5-dienecarbonyl-CoA hydratase